MLGAVLVDPIDRPFSGQGKEYFDGRMDMW